MLPSRDPTQVDPSMSHPPDHTGHMAEQLDIAPQLRLVSTSRMPHRLNRATRQEGLRGVARARAALAATARPPEIDLHAA